MAELDVSLLEALEERSREHPVPAVDGVVLFDVRCADSVDTWYVTMKKGIVTVARKGGEPDCVLTGGCATFDAVLSGRANAMAALLRGAFNAEGKIILLSALQQLFPDSPGTAGLPAAGYAERRS
jgi:putative sterol carrier protein